MDLNLTQPIILNPTLNATLIQSPDPWYKDWFPAIISILVIILGGIITYYVTIIIERNKRQFELKKQVYFEATEIFSDIFQFMILYRYNQEKIQLEKEKLQQEKEKILAKKYGKTKEEYKMLILDDGGGDDILEEIPPDIMEDLIKLIKEEEEAEEAEAKKLSFEIQKKFEIANVEMREKWLETRLTDVIYRLTAIRIKIQICNAPDVIIKLFKELQQYAEENEPNKMVNLIDDKILPEIRNDIAGNDEKKKW